MAISLLLRWAMIASSLLSITSAGSPPQQASGKPWERYIQSPRSRTVTPQRVHAVSGDAVIVPARTDTGDRQYVLHMRAGSQVSLDFGYVGGLLDMSTETTAEGQQFSLAFSESPQFARSISDDTGASPTLDYDKQLNVTVPKGAHTYAMPTERYRGGFKYVTIHAYEDITISDVVCQLGYSPSQEDPGKYSGYFWTPEDDTLVRTWYAGVLTAQSNIGAPNTSRHLPQVKDGWAYNSSLGVEGPMILDGAKRDRAVWPGDLGIAGTTAFLGLGHVGLESVYYALETMFLYQNKSTGQLPFAGPTTGSWRKGALSDTYHAWTLIGCFNFAIFTGDSTWLDRSWGNITAGADFIDRALDNNASLASSPNPDNDWARIGGGGLNSALNALNYHALTVLASLAADTATEKNGRAEQARKYQRAAERLKKSYNFLLWDESQKLYRDNETEAGAKLFPQDGNSLALLYNLTTSASQAKALSSALTRNWNAIGPVTPELPDTISSFISSVEVLAHYAARKPKTGLELMRRTWGYMLDSPLMTGTTLVEGMAANGSLYYRSQRGYKYDAAYTSLSHSWSTGPTQALSFKAVGLEIVSWGGRWVFAPQPGDLNSLRTGFESPLGWWEAVIETGGREDGRKIDIELSTPEGTKGTIVLPWTCAKVTIDGVEHTGGEVKGGGKKNISGRGCRLTSC